MNPPQSLNSLSLYLASAVVPLHFYEDHYESDWLTFDLLFSIFIAQIELLCGEENKRICVQHTRTNTQLISLTCGLQTDDSSFLWQLYKSQQMHRAMEFGWISFVTERVKKVGMAHRHSTAHTLTHTQTQAHIALPFIRISHGIPQLNIVTILDVVDHINNSTKVVVLPQPWEFLRYLCIGTWNCARFSSKLRIDGATEIKRPKRFYSNTFDLNASTYFKLCFFLQ